VPSSAAATCTALDAGTLDAALARGPDRATCDLTQRPTIVDLLVATGLTESRGAARRTVAEGGAYVNNTKVPDESWIPAASDLLAGGWLVVAPRQAQPRGVPASPADQRKRRTGDPPAAGGRRRGV
jgi:tyrosyl-tRNA synthetase